MNDFMKNSRRAWSAPEAEQLLFVSKDIITASPVDDYDIDREWDITTPSIGG